MVTAESTDVVILGAGPAGLAAAIASLSAGRSTTVIEAGPCLSERDHGRPEHLANGVGGCGLFSDGKFSFYPSASGLWRLSDHEALRGAWSWLVDILRKQGIDPPPFPSAVTEPPSEREPRKRYPSMYVPLAKRKAIIAELERNIGHRLLVGCTVESIDYSPSSTLFRVAVNGQHHRTISAHSLILATGRFGPLSLPRLFPQLSTGFRHFEIGVRIVQDAESFFLAGDGALDPKVIITEGDIQWRTFCCCREGEVVSIPSAGLLSVSGRADGNRTKQSNVGLNVRIRDEAMADELGTSLLHRMAQLVSPVEESVGSFLAPASARRPPGPVRSLLGDTLSDLFARGLNALQAVAPGAMAPGSLLVAPALEGVGRYPLLRDLQAIPYRLWVAGDCTGVFRGLTAALLSGHYCGNQASHTFSRSQ